MRRKFISIILTAWVLLMMPMTAFAQSFDADRLGSISVTLMNQDGKTPIAGAELSLYYVASLELNSNNNLSYTFTNTFEDCGCALDDPALSVKLDAFVKEHSVPAEKLVTDAQGRVVFGNLPLGLYYLKQTNYVGGYAPCKPFIVSVPDQSNGKDIYDIKANPKTETAKFIDITIRKVWDVDEFTKIADHVTVDLLRDGFAVKTAVLTETNNWEVTYSGMPESDSYSIVELNVPEGFTAVYTRKGYEFTVTNSFCAEISDDEDGEGSDIGDFPSPGGGKDDSELIQTGQTVWPIPVLTMAGLGLIVVGTIVLRKTRDNNA